MSHYQDWTEDNERRMLRKNGWNDITDAYWGKLPDDWPYTSRVVDPRIRTSIIEKNARLLNSKLRGRLVPREGGDILNARINNAILDYQWDNANYGGTMLSKWSMMDQDTRLYASKFGLVSWRVTKDKDGKLTFEGNEFNPLDIRDCGIDFGARNIRDAKWFQHRQWVRVEDLEKANKNKDGIEVYPGLSKLIEAMRDGQDRRDTAYLSRIKQLKGLTDRLGEDDSFPVVEMVTEYRMDRWITFSPKHSIILRDIPNPYWHQRIPIVQLCYYPLNDDPIGESEVEPVLPIWRAIQAVVCGFIDNMNLHIRPPLKIVEGSARIETIVYGPEAQWLMDRPDAVTEMQGSGEALRYFETTYSALVSAFNSAMGDISQGISAVDPFNPQKTATEVRQSARQQNVRDQSNQIKLAEALEDMMSMWLSNNRQFLFADPKKHEHVLRVVGSEEFEYFKRSGMDQMILPEESAQEIAAIISQTQGNVSDEDINQMVEAGKVPRFPVKTKDGFKPKMRISELGDEADISVVPEDTEGNYDYIADVKSMASGADQELRDGQQRTVMMITNPAILQLLQAEGVKPKIKDLLINILENEGNKDAARYFEQLQTAGLPGSALPPGQVGGMPGTSSPIPAGSPTEQMAGSPNLPQPGEVSGGLQLQPSQSVGV